MKLKLLIYKTNIHTNTCALGWESLVPKRNGKHVGGFVFIFNLKMQFEEREKL